MERIDFWLYCFALVNKCVLRFYFGFQWEAIGGDVKEAFEGANVSPTIISGQFSVKEIAQASLEAYTPFDSKEYPIKAPVPFNFSQRIDEYFLVFQEIFISRTRSTAKLLLRNWNSINAPVFSK